MNGGSGRVNHPLPGRPHPIGISDKRMMWILHDSWVYRLLLLRALLKLAVAFSILLYIPLLSCLFFPHYVFPLPSESLVSLSPIWRPEEINVPQQGDVVPCLVLPCYASEIFARSSASRKRKYSSS